MAKKHQGPKPIDKKPTYAFPVKASPQYPSIASWQGEYAYVRIGNGLQRKMHVNRVYTMLVCKA